MFGCKEKQIANEGHFDSSFVLSYLHNWRVFLFPAPLSVGKMFWVQGPGRHHGPPVAVATHPTGFALPLPARGPPRLPPHSPPTLGMRLAPWESWSPEHPSQGLLSVSTSCSSVAGRGRRPKDWVSHLPRKPGPQSHRLSGPLPWGWHHVACVPVIFTALFLSNRESGSLGKNHVLLFIFFFQQLY